MTDITLTPAQFQTLLDLLGTADTGEQEYQLTMNLTAKLLLLRMSGGAPALTAAFTSVATNLSVAFTDTSTGSPTSWAWDFGDGGTSTLQNPTHVYAGHGTYTVELQVNAGASTITHSVTVNTAFHNAVVAKSPRRFYDIGDTSGVVATDSGSDGVNGAYALTTLGQTGLNGTNDAGIQALGGGQLTASPISGTLTSFTLVTLFKPTGALEPLTSAILGSTSLGGYVFLDIYDDGHFDVTIGNDSGGAGAVSTTAGALTTGNWTALYIVYDGTTGAITVRTAVSSTLVSPSLASDTAASPVGGLAGLDFSNGSLVTAAIGATGGILDAFAVVPSALSVGEIGVINSAIAW